MAIIDSATNRPLLPEESFLHVSPNGDGRLRIVFNLIGSDGEYYIDIDPLRAEKLRDTITEWLDSRKGPK